MFDKTQQQQMKEELDCRDICEHLLGPPAKRSARTWHWQCPFHDDRDPSLAVWPDGWHCFGCSAYGDHYDLVMRIEGIGFLQAHTWLVQRAKGVGSSSVPLSHKVTRVLKPSKPPVTWQGKQADWRMLVDNATLRLDTGDGASGQAYLQARGILPETWHAWSLGYLPNVQRWNKDQKGKWMAEDMGPAVVLPWTNGRLIKAVQYRLFHHAQRYHQEIGGDRTLFGIQHLAHRPTLMVVEGELNAVSIWQESHDFLDVVSFGPEGNVERAAHHLQSLASGYERKIVWADKPEVARIAQKAVGATQALRSPIVQTDQKSIKYDANELLRQEMLRSFMERLLGELTDPRFDDLTAERLFRHLRASGQHDLLLEFESLVALEAHCGELHSLTMRYSQDRQLTAMYKRYSAAWELCRGLQVDYSVGGIA